MAKLPEITLPTHLKERLVQGHPWVYRNHLTPDGKLSSGSWVRVRCGSWTGFGLWEQQGPIALRIFSQRQLPDRRWWQHQIQQAWALREPLRQQDCTAYRWLFGEGDGLPGITVDLYGQFAVLQTYMQGAAAVLEDLVASLRATAPLGGILLRTQHDAELQETGSKTRLLWGNAPPDEFVAEEYGLQFSVNLQTGQKTGLFLDQRDNRRTIQAWSQGRSVLNCFAYTGGFSIYALKGGAEHVVSLDIGKGLAASAERNVKLNRLDPQRHQFVTADCFEQLNQYRQQGRKFDLVILDPPSFAKSKQNRFAAVRAYTKLNALALGCMAPHGLLVSASCTSQVSPEAFKDMLAVAAAQSHCRLQILHEAGHALDHPVPAQFPEGRYLKFVISRVQPLA